MGIRFGELLGCLNPGLFERQRFKSVLVRCEMTLQQRGVKDVTSEFTLVTNEIAGRNQFAMFICIVLSHGLKRSKDSFTPGPSSTLGRDALSAGPSLSRVRGIREFDKFEIGVGTIGGDGFH